MTEQAIRDLLESVRGGRQSIDEAVAIGPAGIPAVSTWEMAVMGSFLLIAGTIVVLRRRSMTAR